MNVLLTGGNGFVGSHCVNYFLKNTDWNLILLNRCKDLGERFSSIVSDFDESRVRIFGMDLSKHVSFQDSLDINLIINLASSSNVEQSTVDPVSFLKNNFELTINMLELARQVKPQMFIQVSSDEVYGEVTDGGPHKEWDAIVPSTPYAASKAAQEAVAIAYWRTYDVPLLIANTMNIIGEGQNPSKFIPTIIKMVLSGKKVSIFGESIDTIGARKYLHAENFADAMIFLSNLTPAKYNNGECAKPDRFNVCGESEFNNLELAEKVALAVGKPLKWELVKSDSARPGYNRVYALNDSKLRESGWSQPISFDKSIERIVSWNMNKY